MRQVAVLTTGGTIEKTFDEVSGTLLNRRSIVRRMLGRLRLEDADVRVQELLSKDSLLMTDEDRALIVAAARSAESAMSPGDGIVILHGTDTLHLTGERLTAELAATRVPIVLTGAMRPFEMTRSDALQNLTESIFATGLLPPGVYCTAHGRVLKFPGVVKDRERGTFVRAGS